MKGGLVDSVATNPPFGEENKCKKDLKYYMTQKAGTVLDRYMYLIVNSKVTLLKFLVL